MDPVTLTTDRLVLRTVDARHTDSVYAAAQDPDIQRWTTIPTPYRREHARSFTQEVAPEGWACDTMYTWGVFLPEGEDLVGMLSITMRSPGTAEIGYWGTKEYRGNGYLTEATRSASHWAFDRAGVDRMEWRAEVGNHASRAVAERAGFTIEGTLRSAIINKGVRRDCWLASLLPSDLSLPSTAPYTPTPPPTT
jgi:RimJ/RimL family protein N-acetyltransferase